MTTLEYWDLYTINRELTGEKHQRGKTIPQGRYRLTVHLCLFNANNQLLIQQRQSDKADWPNMWDFSVAGSAIAGEDSRQAIERETKEELGLSIDLTSKRPRFTLNFPEGFDDYWISDCHVGLSELTLQESEVQNARWVSETELLALAETDQFIPYFFLKDLFKLKDSVGFAI